MRNLIVALLIVLMTVSMSIAQTQFGATLGLNMGSFSSSNGTSETTDTKIGFGIGGVVSFPLNKMMDLKTGAVLLQKGGKETEDFFGTTIESSIDMMTLTIPIFISYNLSEGDAKPYVFGGPEIGLLLKSEVTASFEDEVDITFDTKDSTATIELAFSIGAGYSMLVADMPAFVDVRYSLGLSNLDDSSSSSDFSLKSRGIQIFAGVYF